MSTSETTSMASFSSQAIAASRAAERPCFNVASVAAIDPRLQKKSGRNDRWRGWK
jgi:hypothetical protein